MKQIAHLAFGKSSIPGVEQPAWSPDGRRIAFDSNWAGPGANLFTVRPDGTGLVQLTHLEGDLNA